MAKERDIEGLSARMPFAEAAALVVETRTDELMGHSEGVLDMAEISGVHDMRVATRRLRAALEVFAPCFPKADHAHVLEEVKAIADALGERRDRDVAILSLTSFAAEMPTPDRPGHRLARGPFSGRAVGREHRARAVRHGEAPGAARPRPAQAHRRREGDGVKAKRIKGLDPGASLAEGAAQTVKVRLAELLGFLPRSTVGGRGLRPARHGIAAKRVRYVLEATGFCFGKPAEPARRAARDLQDLLGEMHDADVMLPRLAEHRRLMREEDAADVKRSAGSAKDLEPVLAGQAPHRTAYRGLEVYEVYLLARRSLLFDRFCELCATLERRGVWSSLEQAADRELEAARRRREAAERAERLRQEVEAAEALLA